MSVLSSGCERSFYFDCFFHNHVLSGDDDDDDDDDDDAYFHVSLSSLPTYVRMTKCCVMTQTDCFSSGDSLRKL